MTHILSVPLIVQRKFPHLLKDGHVMRIAKEFAVTQPVTVSNIQMFVNARVTSGVARYKIMPAACLQLAVAQIPLVSALIVPKGI